MTKSTKQRIHVDATHFARSLHAYVRMKWTTPEEKEAWYTKFSAVRRRKMIRCSEAQGHRCASCGADTWLSQDERVDRHMLKWQQATLEHVTPQSEGGRDNFHNVIMTCTRCNAKRGSMDIYEFYRIMQDPARRALFMRSTAESRAAYRERKEARKAEKHPLKMERAAFRLALFEFTFPGALAWWSGLSAEDRMKFAMTDLRDKPNPPTKKRSRSAAGKNARRMASV